MTSSTNPKINIVIVAETEENARTLADKIGHLKVSESDLWHEHREGIDIFTYIRWPGCKISAAPIGITDIILAYSTKKDSEKWDFIKNYVDERKSVPFKYLISSDDLSKDAEQMQLNFHKYEDVVKGNDKEKIIKAAMHEEKVLREIFNRMDLDENGAINEKEILSISKALNNPLNPEDAKEIIKLLSNQGKIFYDKFKQWWVMGRADFNSFRRLVQIELLLKNVLKSKQEIDSYLAPILLEAKSDLLQSSRIGILNINPEKDFDTKTSINWHFTMGNDYNEINKTLPSYISNSSINLGIELYLHNDNDGPLVLEHLNSLKKEMITNNPNLKWIEESVMKINLRHVGNSIFIDLTPKAGVDDQTQNEQTLWGVIGMAYSGYLDLHLCTKLSIREIFFLPFENLVKNLSNMKLEVKAEYPKQINVFDYLLDTVVNSINNDPFKYFMKFLVLSKNYNLAFQYELKNLRDIILELSGKFFDVKETDQTEDLESKWKEFKNYWSKWLLENIPYFGLSNLKNYKNLLHYLFLDNNSIYINSPVMKFYTKVNFILDDFVKVIEKM